MVFRVGKSKNTLFHVFWGGKYGSSRKWQFKAVLRLLPKKATYVAKNPECYKGCSKVFVDITKSANQGGPCVPGFWRTFLQKITFLSDQEVPGCHKNIYRDFRTSFTTSEIFGNICCFFRQQTQHCFKSLCTASTLFPTPKYVEKCIFWLSNPKYHLDVFDRPINIARDGLDILLHFPNDWYKNIQG